MFTSKSSLMKATKLATDAKIVVNTDLKKLFKHSDRAVVLKEIPIGTSTEAVHTALSEFGLIKLIKMQLSILVGKDAVHVARSDLDKETWDARDCYRALLYTLPMGTNAHDIWDFVCFVSEKTCIIDHHPVTYVWTRCATVCFDSAELLNAVMGTMPVLKGGKSSSGGLPRWVFSVTDKSRPAAIYAKHLAPIAHLVSFGSVSWAKIVGELAKKLDSFMLAVFQPSSGYQLSVTSPSQDQISDVVIGEGSGEATGSDIAAILVFFALSEVKRLENLVNDHLDAGVAIIMNNSLAQHESKVSEFSQAGDINSMIAKAVNKTSFVIFGGDFNEDGSHRCASFRKCFDLGLVNSLGRSFLVRLLTWCNSHGVTKTIDYMFVSSNLVNAIVDRGVMDVIDFFDTNHKTVSVFVGLGNLLNVQLSFLCKQANKDHWKFDVKNINAAKWLEFKDASAVNASMFLDAFVMAKRFSDIDIMWDIVCKIVVISAGGTFKKKWFKNFDSVFNKVFSKLHKLELLVSKLVKSSHLVFDRLDSVGVLSVKSLFLLGSSFDTICSELAKARKSYCSFKLLESKCAGEAHIRWAIKGRMESFEIDKRHTIKSVLERFFCKMVLDYLVVGNELVLEPKLVKFKIDEIMKGWTRKRIVVSDISDDWVCQFQPLDYVFNGAFSDVMCSIGFDEMFDVKHCDRRVLNMFLVLLNSCLEWKSVPELWREAWVSMIPKLYEWKGVLTNICPIALIETARKIFSKILSDRISLACSKFNVLRRDNFSVLKSMMTQLPIFAIGSVVEDTYDSVGWKHLERSLVRIKMCNRFIRFFGSIYNGRTNKVMTNFGLTNGYHVHDGLDQSEVFSLLLWQIFYDLLLCKIKRQKSLCGYRLISHFISKTGHVESQAGLTSFLAASVFIDDTIWVGSSQAVTQYILNVASEFFRFNDISINNDKTVIANPYLIISGLPIFIVKKGESHWYLRIFLSSEGLSKPNLAKAYSDVRFFINLVLRKAISDKQFAYLVSIVFFSIISYRTQFSFVSISVFYHSSLYSLKTFEQIQAESKSASIIAFANSAFSWHLRHSLLFPAYINVNSSNNFLAGVVCIFSGCDLFLNVSFASAFHLRGSIFMSLVLGENFFFKCVSLFKRYGIAFVDQLHDWNGVIYNWKFFKYWKRLDSCGLVPFWFDFSVRFLNDAAPSSACFSSVNGRASSDICLSHDFGVVCDDLLATNVAAHLSVYTDGSLSGLGTVDMKAGVAVFFENINLGLRVEVSGLVSSMLTKLQAFALALKCVPSFHSVDLFSDSQAALDACKAEFLLARLDFRNQC
ncbi:hypothetical protein G9A89_003358 [Geosiphon pyriformis]|nr:hypothetical protein G9A89_003358 [Geosiphon pyriformis]